MTWEVSKLRKENGDRERKRPSLRPEKTPTPCREKALMAYNLQDDTIRFVFSTAARGS